MNLPVNCKCYFLFESMKSRGKMPGKDPLTMAGFQDAGSHHGCQQSQSWKTREWLLPRASKRMQSMDILVLVQYNQSGLPVS